MTWKPHVRPRALLLRLTSIAWGAVCFFAASGYVRWYVAAHVGDPRVFLVTALASIAALLAWVVVGPALNWRARRLQRLYNPAVPI